MSGVESVLNGHKCIKLGFLKKVHQLTGKKPGAKVELDDIPELFTGLGCMPGTYHMSKMLKVLASRVIKY